MTQYHLHNVPGCRRDHEINEVARMTDFRPKVQLNKNDSNQIYTLVIFKLLIAYIIFFLQIFHGFELLSGWKSAVHSISVNEARSETSEIF